MRSVVLSVHGALRRTARRPHAPRSIVGLRAGLSVLLIVAGVVTPATGRAAENAEAAASPQTPSATAPEPLSTAAVGPELTSVVVTARRRAESLLSVPESLTAVPAATLSELNLTDLQDISAYTPDLYDQSTGSFRADRSFEQTVIRGIVDPFNPTVLIFQDGAPVPQEAVQNLGPQVERVEVLRGPQSAAFGQQTFAGAINYVTKDPGNEFHGYAETLFGNYDWQDTRAGIEGPLIADKLAARVDVRYYSTQGMYANPAEPGQRLGDQSTRSIDATLVFKPLDGLRVRMFGDYWEDDDGTGAYGTFSQSPVNTLTCNAGAPPTNAPNYLCGTLPHFPGAALGLNDTPTPQFITQGLQNSLGLLRPIYDTSFLSHGGLKRDAWTANVAIEYVIPGVGTLSSVTAGDIEKFMILQDLAGVNTLSLPNAITPFPPTIAEPSYISWQDYVQQWDTDFSQELRLTSPTDQPFRWLIGASYHRAEDRDYVAAFIPFGIFEFGNGAPYITSNTGVFTSLNYDFSPKWTATVEARYQRYVLEQDNRAPDTLLAAESFKQAPPRVSIQYKATPDTMAYALYSRGYGNGSFNFAVLALPAALQGALLSQYGASDLVRPATLDNFEVGLKGTAFDKRLEYSLAAFYDLWRDQLLNESVVVNENGAPVAVGVINNVGQSTVKGGELESRLLVTSHLSLNVAVGFADATFDHDLPCPQCAAINGAAVIRAGATVPGSSKLNGTVGAQYRAPLVDQYNWFVRGDYLFRSGVYVDYTNVVRTPDTNKVNLRAGVGSERFEFQVFVDNLFNDYAYNGVAYESAPLGGNGIAVGLPTLRQYGARLGVKF